MIDPSIDLKRLLKGQEEALWAVRVSEETLTRARKRSIRGTYIFVCFLFLGLIYAAYEYQGSLFRGESIASLPSHVFVIAYFILAAGAASIGWYSLRALKADLAEEKPSIYLITTKRLLATTGNYTRIYSMRVDEIDHVFTMGSEDDELIIGRKNDTDLDNAFYITNAPNLNNVKSIIEKLIPKGQT